MIYGIVNLLCWLCFTTPKYKTTITYPLFTTEHLIVNRGVEDFPPKKNSPTELELRDIELPGLIIVGDIPGEQEKYKSSPATSDRFSMSIA